MIDRTDSVFAQNEIELLWSMEIGTVYYENQIRQQRD